MSTDLSDLSVRYVTYRDQPADARAMTARTLAAARADERVLLETCHRVELATVGAGRADGIAGTREVRGRDAVARVLTVTAGFDSAVPAEEQLLGQVRTAYESALAAGATGPVLNELFRRALRFGRRVRSHATPGVDRSLVAPAIAWLGEQLEDRRGRVLVAGTGEIGRRAAEALATGGHRVTVLSRSPDRAEAVRAALPGAGHEAVTGPVTAGRLASADALVLAVRGGTPLVGEEAVATHRPWVVDLSVPSQVTSGAAAVLGDRLRVVDELEGDASTVLPPRVAARLRRELDEEVDAFVAWLEARRGATAVALLHDEAERVRRHHLERLRARARLDDGQLAAVEAAAAAIVGELLHRPSVVLRRGGADAGTVRRLFGIDGR